VSNMYREEDPQPVYKPRVQCLPWSDPVDLLLSDTIPIAQGRGGLVGQSHRRRGRYTTTTCIVAPRSARAVTVSFVACASAEVEAAQGTQRIR
jgi:hypothetical protein